MLQGDVAAAVAALKQEEADLLVMGSTMLIELRAGRCLISWEMDKDR